MISRGLKRRRNSAEQILPGHERVKRNPKGTRVLGQPRIAATTDTDVGYGYINITMAEPHVHGALGRVGTRPLQFIPHRLGGGDLGDIG